jgi:uncharacterized phage protein (TIGR02218 family)
MREISPTLKTALDAGVTTLCDCWRLVRRDGLAMGFTDHDEDLLIDGTLYRASSAVGACAQESATGLAADTTEISGALTDDAITASDIDAGLYDGARIERWLVDWRDPDQKVCLFAGHLGDITREGAAFKAEVLGLAAALNATTGRVFQPLCDARLGDGRCGVTLQGPPYVIEARILSIDDGALAIEGIDTQPGGWFANGRLRWSSGDETTIIGHWLDGTVHRISLQTPGGGVGETCTLVVGCDRRAETCRGKFDNIINFRGFPHMPGEDWALTAAPDPGGRHDGGAL